MSMMIDLSGSGTEPKRYLSYITSHEAMIAPDYSLYSDLLRALQIYNTYRNYLIGSWLQGKGILTIPNARLDGDLSLDYTLTGIPEYSTIAIGAHGCTKNRVNRKQFIQEVKRLVDLKQPTNLIVYGSDAYGVFDYPRSQGIPVDVFPCETNLAFKGVVHGKAK